MKKVETYKLKKLWRKLKPHIKMDNKIIKFDDIEIDEHKFYQYNSPISINEIDINEASFW